MPDIVRRRFLLGVFVVSGFNGLIYESIWSHYLKLFLGHAAYAQTLVLAIFMGGMALGSWAVARNANRISRPLWGYVLIEGLVGVLALVFHPVFVASTNFSFTSIIPMLPGDSWITAYKWSLAALLILPQSALLGMTFPLISSGMIRLWPDRPGETLAALYFANSLGAAIGVLVSGFVLIAAVGLPGTIGAAGTLNVALALAIWASLRGQVERGAAPSPVPTPVDPASLLDRWFIAAAILTGSASLMYELGWIRMLSLVLGSSTHSFELMLSAFIFGLALGGLLVRRRIERIGDPLQYLAYVMLATGTLAALTLPAYNLTFDLMAWFLRTIERSAGGYAAYNLFSQLIAAIIMLPAATCAGMTLPLLTRELMRRGTGERAIGIIYSANTFGAIIGVLLTVHLLMPTFGIKGVILAGAGIHIALGLSRFLAILRHPSRLLGFSTALCIGIFCYAFFSVRLDPLRMTSGVYRTGSALLPDGAAVDYLRDGKTATVSLVEVAGKVTIATNGKPDASIQMGPGETSPDEVTAVLAAAIPLSMLPRPVRVANIGFGSGLTTHTLLASELVTRLDSIEIEPLMVEAARKGFGARIGNVFDDPRSHIIYDDAKTFLAASREPYDLIVSEPSNPWVSGVASLFSAEFYDRIAHHLSADGYFVQWIQVYETNTEIVASVVKALAPHFRAYALYNVDDVDMLIIATRGAALRDPDEALIHSPLMRVELQHVGVQSAADFRSRQIGTNLTIGPLLESLSVPANSDFYPYVDLNAPRLRYLQASAIELPALTDLPIPFLELLGGPAQRESTVAPAVNSPLFRDRLVKRALDIRAAVANNSQDDLDPLTARYLWLIDMSRERCTGAAGRNQWQDAVKNINDETSAYLRADELQQLWKQVTSSPCYLGASGKDKAWVDLWSAVAQRDAPSIADLGTAMLGGLSSSSDAELAYLTTVTSAAYVRVGDSGKARGLLQAQRLGLDRAGQFDLALRDLWALTKPTDAPSLQTAP